MRKTAMRCICLLLLGLPFLMGGCATVGTIALSSAFGLVGRESINYFDSGSRANQGTCSPNDKGCFIGL